MEGNKKELYAVTVATKSSLEQQTSLLSEILIRLKAIQNSLDQKDIEEILNDPKYRRALKEAEADIIAGRERILEAFLKDVKKPS